MRALSRGCCLFAVFCVVSCAEGYEGLSSLRLNQTVPKGSAGNSAPIAGGGKAGSSAGMGSPAPVGAECEMGETESCDCASTGTEGVHQCKQDPRSSKGGYFATECTRCAPPVVQPNPGDVMMDGGLAGSGGSSSTAGSGGSGGSTGSSGSGGSAGTMATGGRPGSCTPACTNSCFPVGILACCRPVGGCGCTWAPGAYCF
jgi:hypothetical protein